MKFWALLILGAVSPFLLVSTLSSKVALLLLLLTAVVALLLRLKSGLRVFCVLPAVFFLTSLQINDRISQRLPLSEGKNSQLISGVIASLPDTNEDGTRFVFLPDKQARDIASKILVSWYKEKHPVKGEDMVIPRIRAGERWRLQLELRSPRGKVNFHGMDAERWYFTEGISALAYVQKGNNIRLAEADWYNLSHWRELVLERLTEKAGDVPAFRMLVALAIADRRGLMSGDRQVLAATGTGHLLAISGLHIGLAAALGGYLGRLLILFLPMGIRQGLAMILPWLTAWAAALAYSALSGFGVSTQRALIMLSIATLVMLGRRNVHPLLAWLVAMALVILSDPFAPLRAGFWFSFLAVAILLALFVPRYGYVPVWRRMLHAQLGISLVMAPLGMYWFQQASLPGLLANLIAIPIVSMLIVPLILLALLVLWIPGSLAAWLLGIAGWSTHWLFLMLGFLSGFQPASFSSSHVPGFEVTILAMVGAAIFLLPRGFPIRFPGLLLMIPLLLPVSPSLARAETQVDFMDVGQGLAVLVSTRDYLMLYDTGPGNGMQGEQGWDMVKSILAPMITATNRSPDLIVASHADLDHAGGLSRLHALYPDARFMASLPAPRTGIHSCNSPQEWLTNNLNLRILHPSTGLPYLGNDSSCVISVKGSGFSLLLSGDISRIVEQRLVAEGLEAHAILTAPHHGSATSSSKLFIDTVKPSLALLSTALNNRFDFPRADVMARYSAANVMTLDTAQCGGLRITTEKDKPPKVESARKQRKSIWRWPASTSCP